MTSKVDARRRRSSSIDQDVMYLLGTEIGWNIAAAPSQSMTRPVGNVENAGAVDVRRHDFNVMPALRQPDGGLGYRDGWAAVSLCEPRDDVKDPHRGPCIDAVTWPAGVSDPDDRPDPSCN